MAIPEQYDGSSDWDEWLEHFEDAAVVNGWNEAEKLKWLPLSLSQKARSTFRQLPPTIRSSYRNCLENRRRHAQESWSDIGRDIRRLVEKAYPTLSDDAKDIIGLDKFLNGMVPLGLNYIRIRAHCSFIGRCLRYFIRPPSGGKPFLNTLDRPELVLLVKQRNPKNIEEAVRAALEVESFMIRPVPGLLIGTTIQTPYNADPAKNETSSDISRLTSCLERMQLRLTAYALPLRKGWTPRPKLRKTVKLNASPSLGQDGGDVTTTRKDPHPGSDLMAVVGKIDGCPTNILIDTGSAVTLVQSGVPTEPWHRQSSIYPSSGDCGESCAASSSWPRFPLTIRLQAEHSRCGAANQWGKCSVDGGDHSKETISAGNSHGPWLLEQRPEGRLPVAVARAVVHPREGCVPVQLLNPSGDKVTIHQGKVVATIEIVDPLPLERSPKTHVALPTAIEKLLDEVAQRTTSEELDKLRALLTDFADVFSTYDGDLGRTTRTEHHINTGDAQPIRLCPRRIPWHFREQMDGLLTDMINKDIIEPSTSPWTAPVVLVKKKDGNVRFCVDFRKLNLVTKKDSYPLPRIDETIDTLAGAEWFSTLDLTSGYWQVPVAKEDREKTALCTPKGLYQFKVMPFGLCNAPATFQRVMDLTLTGLKWKMFSVLERHSDLWENIPGAPQQSGRSTAAHQTIWLKTEASEMPTEIVASWPTPTSTSEIRNFLGLASYYRRFVKSFASIARPLHRLTEQRRQFSWSNEAEEAFQRLKRALTTAPILAFPRFDIPFIIDTDASETGIGAVLSQKHDPEGERVIAYASRTLSKTERKYSTKRKELLSIVYTSLSSSDPKLLGSEPEGQVARWLEHLQEYDMEVVHRRGRQHNNADAMSRRPEVTEGNGDHPTTEMPSTAVGTAAVSLALNEGAEPLEAPQDENIECESRDLVKQWKHLRLTPAGLAVVVTGKPCPSEHSGTTTQWNRRWSSWCQENGRKSWYRDVNAWCDRCKACARRKTPPIVNRAPMESIVVGNPMEIVAVDILGPVPRSKNGNSYIMVVTNYFTRWVEAYALPNQQAETVARKLVQQFVCRFGTPIKLLSDQGTQFQGRLVTELCKLLGIEKIRTTAYHPQCDGMVERFNRTLAMMLRRAMEIGTIRDYVWAPSATPSRCSFQHEHGERNDHLQIRRRVGSPHLKRMAGNTNYQTQEAVWLYCPLNKDKRNRKFAIPWTGPFEIIQQVSGVNYRIQRIGSPRRTQLEQDRRDGQFNTKLRTYCPRLVWAEVDRGLEGTSTPAVVSQRPRRKRNPPTRYNDYILYRDREARLPENMALGVESTCANEFSSVFVNPLYACVTAFYRYSQLNKSNATKKKPLGWALPQQSNEGLTVSGKRWVKLEIGNQAFTHPVVIVENLVQQALLGRDFLRRFACRLNIADAVLQINGESVRLVEATTARSKVDVIIEEDVTLAPFTECCVMARTTSADNCHGPWLLEQRSEGRLPVAVARTVMHPREGCIPVQLLNPSGDRVTIHRGKVVAKIEVVDPLPLERSPKTHVALPTAIEKLLDEVAQRNTSEELDKLRASLTDFADVFSTYDGDFGRTTRTEHHINTGDAQPI
ncbi:Retrovirus-related Pol polyprotein from transposon 17.6 [Trichinella sp. T6]|nr:Retrovirus-related Pol polyprotein from transposon 17.6 [Trichinella sp. T6]